MTEKQDILQKVTIADKPGAEDKQNIDRILHERVPGTTGFIYVLNSASTDEIQVIKVKGSFSYLLNTCVLILPWENACYAFFKILD